MAFCCETSEYSTRSYDPEPRNSSSLAVAVFQPRRPAVDAAIACSASRRGHVSSSASRSSGSRTMPGKAAVTVALQPDGDAASTAPPKSCPFVLKKVMDIPPPNILEEGDDGKRAKIGHELSPPATFRESGSRSSNTQELRAALVNC